jgi:hypothetical protein
LGEVKLASRLSKTSRAGKGHEGAKLPTIKGASHE